MKFGWGNCRTVLLALLLALMVGAPIAASAHGFEGAGATCANLLEGGTFKTILRQAHELGVVEDPARPLTLEQVYLALKEAEWAEPPPNLHARLAEHRQKHFQIGAMNDVEVAQFYKNSLNGLYQRVAELWRVQEVRTQVGSVMLPELEAVLARVLKQAITPWGFEDRDLTPQAAHEHFAKRPWMFWPWQKITGFLVEWREFRPNEKFDARAFGKFWEERGERHGINFEFFQRLNRALAQDRAPSICCKSEPGCVSCPLNRRWRHR